MINDCNFCNSMSDKKDPKIVILIVFIVDFPTKKQNILYNYSLIITKRI